jgi:phage gp29-like protein
MASLGATMQRFGASLGAPPRIDAGLPPVQAPYVTEKALKQAQSVDAAQGFISSGAGPSYDRNRTYPARELDPEKIDQVFRNADRGQYMVEYGDLWQQLGERDYQLYSLDRGRRVGITTKRFQITASDPRDEVSVGLRNATEAMVDGIDAFDTDGIYSMLSANGPGYSLVEILYEFGVISFPWNGSTISVETLNPRALRFVHHKHLSFGYDSDAPFLNLGGDGNLPLAAAPYKWLWYRSIGDGIASTRGFMRPTTYLHLMRQTSLVSGAIFLKLFGIPQIAAYVEEAKYKDATLKAIIDECLASYGNGTPTVFPGFMEGRLKVDPGPIGSGAVDVHMKWSGFIDACMAKAVQGAVLQVEASGGGPGSYAQSQTHENRSYDVAVCDSIGTCGATKAQLFRNWIRLNARILAKAFGVPPEALLSRTPSCSRRLDREVSPKERAEIANMFAKGGLELSKRQLRNEYAFDTPADEADAFRGEPVVIASGAATVSPADAGKGVENPKPEQSASTPAR